jgi:protein-tyrosine kinase
MSRVHEALRKSAHEPQEPTRQASAILPGARQALIDAPEPAAESMGGPLSEVEEIPYTPLPEALLVSLKKPREAPGEEFRSLRTRLNHLQTMQPLRTLVVTSASPAEGKSFTATNLALTQAQLAGKRILLADFDFRRPTVDKVLQLPVSPGITDYLRGEAPLEKTIRKLETANLYVMTAGQSVLNPLELLNLRECRELIDTLRQNFDWVIIDSPPLLFAADGNLLATMCDGTILVVRIGSTTFETVSRAIQSLCENNILGIVVNGARRGELYSKYSYYHDYYGHVSQQADTTTDLPAVGPKA